MANALPMAIGAQAEGADLLTLAIRGDVTSAPHVAHAGVDGEDGVVSRFFIDEAYPPRVRGQHHR